MQGIQDILNIFMIPPILFLITGVSVGVFSFIKGKRQLETVLFALICVWYSLLMPVFISHHIFKGNISLIMKIERCIHVLYVYGPAILILFSHSLVNKKNRIIEIGAFIFAFIISLFVFTDYYFSGIWIYNWGYIAKGGNVFQIFGLFAMSAIVYSFVLSIKKLKTDIDIQTRLKIKFIMFAVLAIGILTLGNMPALNGINIYPPGNFAFIPMLFMAWGIFRHDAIKINLYTKRRIAGTIVRIFITLMLLAAIPIGFWAIGSYSFSHIIDKTLHYGIPPFISFLCCVFLSYLSLRLGDYRKESIIFSLLMLVYALLSIDIYLNCIITDPVIGLRVSRFSHPFVVFLPALGMHLIRVVTGRRSVNRLLCLNYIISIFLLAFSQSNYYLQGMNVYSWGLFAKKAILFDVMSVVSASTLIYNIVILISAYRHSGNRFFRHRFLFLLIGFASTAILSLGNIPAMNGYGFYPVGNFIFIPVTFFAIALFRHNIPELIRFGGSFSYFGVMSGGVFAAVYLLSVKHSDKYLPLYTGLSIFSILIFDFFLRRLRDGISGRHIKHLQIALENLSDKLSRVRTLDDIAGCISQSFFYDLDCGECSVLIHQENTGEYKGNKFMNRRHEFISGKNLDERLSFITIPSDHPLLGYVETKYSPVKQENIEFWLLNNERAVEMNDPLRRAEIILPVFFENRLSAIILLGVKSSGSMYSSYETAFLYQLGIILGPHIENAGILQRLENTLEERTGKLRDSEKKYRTLLQTNNVGFFEIDLSGKIVSCNDVVLSFTGYTQEEFIGMSFLKIMTPEISKKIFSEYHRVFLKEVGLGSIEHEVIRKDGSLGFVETTVSAIIDKSGNVTGFSTIAVDVSNRKSVENALRESEKKYRHFIENANEIIYKSDWRGNFIYSNPACQKMVEYSNDEISHMNYLDFIPPENRETEYEFYKNQLKNKIDETHRELSLITKSGKILWVEQDVRSVKDENGRIVEFDSIVHDITERKAAEDALRESEMRYQQLMENVSDCVFICKLDGHFKYINHAITRIFGMSQSDLIGAHFLSIVHPDYRDKQIEFYRKQVMENIEITRCEFPVLMKNGEIVWVGQTVRMIKNNEGEIEFYGIARDISNLKKAEDARRDLEEAKTRFFANISHEIRTPLTLMLGPIESVLQGDYGKEIGNDFFKSLHRNTLSLLKLVNNLLDFSKIEAGKMVLNVQEGDMVYFANHYISSIQQAGKLKNINLNLKSSADSIMIFFDPERLDKVFMNLLSNALKFTGEGGTISINLIDDEDYCRIVVSDTGEGIPENSMEVIFDRFSQADTTSTRKYEGTGIGLALVKELVELHGGSITLESRYIEKYPDDHGSVFTVSLPKGIAHLENRAYVKFSEKSNLDDYVKDYRLIGIREIESSGNSEPVPSAGVQVDEMLNSGMKKTVLVVDDNEDMRNFMKVLLRKHYRIILAVNGEEGISIARSQRPDLILTDVMMPVMNGFEMTSIIKNDDDLKTIPVIMLTADTELMNKVTGLENGADDYLHKPFNSMELITRISSLMKNYEYQQIISRRNSDIESELEVARQLQHRLLPLSMPEISGYNEYAVYIPMDKIGGDFYDIENRDGFLNLFIADVSGHGLPGAFLATVTKIALDNIAVRTASNKVLYLLNNVILRHTVKSHFVTAFFAMIDISTNVMRYANAGHTPSILYRKKNDELIELRTKGKPLGWFNDIHIEEKTIQLESGDRIIFYTDGITECSNSSDELYEDERFIKAIKDYSGLSAEMFSKELMKELELFNGGSSFDDDITMMVIDVL